MADKKYTQLTAATLPLAGTEIIALVQSGVSKKTPVSSLITAAQDLSPYLTIAGAAATYSPLSHSHTFASLTTKPTTLAGYGITDTFFTQAQADALYSAIGHVHTFASLTFKPTTIGGYGITDFNSLGDARWSLLAHTHTFASLTSKPTTLAGYGITDAVDNTKFLSASATLDFPSTAGLSSSDLTISVTGAALGDPVILGMPNGSVMSMGSYSAWVSVANTVTVRFSNRNTVTAIDPASGTFKVTVSKI